MNPEIYCRSKAATPGSSLYYGLLFMEPDRRRGATALYAFAQELAEVVERPHDAGVARLKIDWWRTELDRVFAGTAQHPVGKALADAVQAYALPREELVAVIDGRAMDLEHDGYADFAQLRDYCHRVGGVIASLASRIGGHRHSRTPGDVLEIGIALQLAALLRDLGEDLRRGRCYLPRDEMARFGVTRRDLEDGHTSAPVVALLRHQAERAQRRLTETCALLPEDDRLGQLSLLVMAAIHRVLLDEIAADGYRVLERHIALTPLRRLWIAWGTARGERRRAARRPPVR